MSLANDFGKLDETVKLGLCVWACMCCTTCTPISHSQQSGQPVQLAISDPNDSTGDPNSVGDTSQAAYAGNGAIGSIGNIVNQALGGIPQSIGTAIAGAVAPSPTR